MHEYCFLSHSSGFGKGWEGFGKEVLSGMNLEQCGSEGRPRTCTEHQVSSPWPCYHPASLVIRPRPVADVAVTSHTWNRGPICREVAATLPPAPVITPSSLPGLYPPTTTLVSPLRLAGKTPLGSYGVPWPSEVASKRPYGCQPAKWLCLSSEFQFLLCEARRWPPCTQGA